MRNHKVKNPVVIEQKLIKVSGYRLIPLKFKFEQLKTWSLIEEKPHNDK